MVAVKIRNLSKTFHDFQAVSDVSFDIPYGQITAFLGSNGAGKSTTLNMIAGILYPTAGTIEFGSQNYKEHYKDVKEKIGYLTNEMALYETFSIYENLHFLGELKGYSRDKIKKRIEELTDTFSLHDFIHKNYNELSSGQKQRALVASSVIHDPMILIFDEVTASLDIVAAKQIMDYLIKEKEKGKAIIFSTHILSEVEYLSDRIIMIEKGKLIKETTFQELMELSHASNLTDAFHDALLEIQGRS